MPELWIKLSKLLELIDSDEFYDILPGNGQDDFICQWLRQRVERIAEDPHA